MSKERLKIIPGIYLVLIKDNKVLLLRRHNTGYEDGNYSLVGGHVNEGEAYKDAMIREAKEEVDVELCSKNLNAVHVLHRQQNGNRIDVFFAAKEWKGNPKIAESNKCDDVSWFDLDDLPKNMIPFIKQALENIRKDIFYGDFGF